MTGQRFRMVKIAIAKNCKRIKIQTHITNLKCSEFGVSDHFSIYGSNFNNSCITHDYILEKKKPKKRKRS